MKKLIETKPILHTVLWIMVYIVGVNIGDGFEVQTGIPNLVTALILMGLSGILIMYLKRNVWVERFGLKRIGKMDMKQTLYFVPLILLILIQFVAGIDPTLSMRDIAVFCLLMAGVGFIEELLFRGFLFQAIEGKSGVKRAVLISGVTFGLGHI
ncbi:MAG TPA: CPBP family intramembrane glutamic endopeptidase, partial [Clostridiaceae bacterium]|nr:CPBP family intramembrane glutamic endopeptidase [Clostridiaceae bacterium]